MHINDSYILFNKKYNIWYSTDTEHVSLITIWGCKCDDKIFHIKKSYIFHLPLEKTLNIIEMYSIDNLSCNICSKPFIAFDYLKKDQINKWINNLPFEKDRLIIYNKEDIKKLTKNFEFNSIDFISG